MADPGIVACGGCLAVTIVLLLVILLPLSFSYVEYYEYGLQKRKTTGVVNTNRVYASGRYALGPDHTFLTYQADSHLEHLEALSVFSSGGSNGTVGLAFKVDCTLTYFLKQDEVGMLHQELASAYRTVVVSRAKDAIKNEAIFITFQEYFQQRIEVEQRFRKAVIARWDAPPSLHVKLDQFHLGRIQIPDGVATKQLEARIQNERNDRETFLQKAQMEREKTAVEVNTIQLEQAKILQTTEAQASLIRAKAQAEAEKIQADAQILGTQQLVRAINVTSQEHLTAFSYLRMLTKRPDVSVDLTYLAPEGIQPIALTGA